MREGGGDGAEVGAGEGCGEIMAAKGFGSGPLEGAAGVFGLGVVVGTAWVMLVFICLFILFMLVWRDGRQGR